MILDMVSESFSTQHLRESQPLELVTLSPLGVVLIQRSRELDTLEESLKALRGWWVQAQSEGMGAFRCEIVRNDGIPGRKKCVSKVPELRVRKLPPGNREGSNFPNVDALGAGRMRLNRTFLFLTRFWPIYEHHSHWVPGGDLHQQSLPGLMDVLWENLWGLWNKNRSLAFEHLSSLDS